MIEIKLVEMKMVESKPCDDTGQLLLHLCMHPVLSRVPVCF